jgi:2-polyprenyl-3-methyl-5-hydroxy-6-metoxy-1,4-benzoquinol methylase
VSPGSLSQKRHWDQGYRDVVLPRTLSMSQYNYFRFDQFFKASLPKGPRRLLEVGCGASAWLVYFAKEFGYRVEGIDYSELGCELARENLRLNQVPANVECRDLFSIKPDEMGNFDLIFTYGVVEHCERPCEVLRTLSSLLAPCGWMVIIVPNMGGIYGPLQRWWNEPVYRIHKVLSPAQLSEDMLGCGLSIVASEYFGTFFLSVVNWSLPQQGSALRRTIKRIVALADRYITTALRNLRVQGESRFFSPYILAIGAKPEARA